MYTILIHTYVYCILIPCTVPILYRIYNNNTIYYTYILYIIYIGRIVSQAQDTVFEILSYKVNDLLGKYICMYVCMYV